MSIFFAILDGILKIVSLIIGGRKADPDWKAINKRQREIAQDAVNEPTVKEIEDKLNRGDI